MKFIPETRFTHILLTVASEEIVEEWVPLIGWAENDKYGGHYLDPVVLINGAVQNVQNFFGDTDGDYDITDIANYDVKEAALNA